MTRLLVTLLTLYITVAPAILQTAAATERQELLRYKVLYKWGMINKKAGEAELMLDPDPDNTMTARLYARNEPWADKFYKLRDTLISVMDPATALPLRYERIAHEDGSYAHDIVEFAITSGQTNAQCTRYRRGKDKTETTKAESQLSATGSAVDMLSAFYYLRRLPFESMVPGTARIINIFSGKRKEKLRITYQGRETLNYNGRSYDTYKVNFSFTVDGKTESSAPIETWLTADDMRIPVKLIGKLKIGKINCLLM